VDAFCREHPGEATRPAFEPFHFCASVEVTAPLGLQAWTLNEFRQCLERVGHDSFHFHFVVSRLRLRLQSNDFSAWFTDVLGLARLAALTNQIDICTSTIDDARAQVLGLVDRELSA